MNFWIPMALSIIFAVLKEVVKNPSSKAELKAAMTKLRDALLLAYPPDQD